MENEFGIVGVQSSGALTVEMVQDWLGRILDVYCGQVLRIKDNLHLEEFERPVLLQCVGDIVHSFELLGDDVVGADTNSILLVGWGIHAELLEEEINWLTGNVLELHPSQSPIL